MNLELTNKQLRPLLDLVYIGNWVLNATRGDDRIQEYDEVGRRVTNVVAWMELPEYKEGQL